MGDTSKHLHIIHWLIWVTPTHYKMVRQVPKQNLIQGATQNFVYFDRRTHASWTMTSTLRHEGCVCVGTGPGGEEAG